ncbi:N-acetylmuramoyl-L-alanine amidase [Bacillus sp. SM2101]|uniref:N-acetylmuramoyl-L-alanine amidase n=1 Tax=Bacillus sp. SM2101 TaxID=2805366 RepID=UPI0033258B71
MSYHLRDCNKHAIGICLVGDFRYEKTTPELEQSLGDLHSALIKDMTNDKQIKGHNEFPVYSWKACSVFNYKKVLKNKEIEYMKLKKWQFNELAETYNLAREQGIITSDE